MKCFQVLSMALVLAAAGSAVGLAQNEPTFKENLAQWLPGMGAEKIPDRRDSQQKLQEALFQLGAPGREAELAEACQAIAEKIGPQTSKPARIWLLRQLEFNGCSECVEAIAALLSDQDPQIRECARRALQNNPTPKANGKLLAALAKASDGKWKVALANSLGARGDQSSVEALGRLLAEKDQAVAAAAANALGKIGGSKAIQALAAAEARTSGKLQIRIADAYLRCADKLLKQGQIDPAAAIYEKLSKPNKPKVIRLAALHGLLRARGATKQP